MSKKIETSVFQKKLSPFLKKIFLFRDLSEATIEEISRTVNLEVVEFEAGENIYTPEDFSKKVGVVMSGECLVQMQKPDGSAIPLNSLGDGDCFGILTLFSSSPNFPTVIKSKKRSKVIFISRDDILKLVKDHYQISLAIISFMSGRIEFLNKKISTFCADTVVEKLTTYILSQYKTSSDEYIVLNFSQTAKILNVGRASIYRAVEALEKMALIKVENKKIYISNLKGLERITL